MKKIFLGIGLLFGLGVVLTAGAAGLAVLGEAPKCPPQKSGGRNLAEISQQLNFKKTVTVSSGEATTIGKQMVGNTISDLTICFDSLGHASGKISLGNFKPSFYVSAGANLSGAYPALTNVDIKVGALPDIPVLSQQVKKIVTDLVNQNLQKFPLKQKHSLEFASGAITIKKF